MREGGIGLTVLDLIPNFTQAAGPASGSVRWLGLVSRRTFGAFLEQTSTWQPFPLLFQKPNLDKSDFQPAPQDSIARPRRRYLFRRPYSGSRVPQGATFSAVCLARTPRSQDVEHFFGGLKRTFRLWDVRACGQQGLADAGVVALGALPTIE
jgi:hypothetical protein